MAGTARGPTPTLGPARPVRELLWVDRQAPRAPGRRQQQSAACGSVVISLAPPKKTMASRENKRSAAAACRADGAVQLEAVLRSMANVAVVDVCLVALLATPPGFWRVRARGTGTG